MLRAFAFAVTAGLIAASCSDGSAVNSPRAQDGAQPAPAPSVEDDAAGPGPSDPGDRATPDEAGGPISDEYAALLPLRGYGHEPSWMVRVERDAVTLSRPGEVILTFPTRQPETGPASFTFNDPESPARAAFQREICRDTATGMPHPFRVRAHAGTEIFEGCGGDPQTLFANANWALALLGGEALSREHHLSIRFEEGRVSGSAGCNRFTGGYTLTGESLTLTRLASTQMACADGAVMDQETRLLARLSQVVMFDLTEDGALELRTGAGDTITAWRTE
ncbi:MAG: META domain-containing protein [Alphaproteobacteria bacterium]|nr:META domain-containing protein [Alphaproteobacteria bacterium]